MKTFNKYDIRILSYYYETKKEKKKKISNGKSKLGFLNKLKVNSILSDDYEEYENLLEYLFSLLNKKYKSIPNIDNDNTFINEGYYFDYKNKTFKFVCVYGQGTWLYVERVI